MKATASIIRHLTAALAIALAALCAAPPLSAAGKAPVWEVVAIADTERSAGTDSSAPALEVAIDDGKILITVDRQCDVEVFTILGQLVTRRKVNPGTVRLTLANRGVYILKAGTATRRINL